MDVMYASFAGAKTCHAPYLRPVGKASASCSRPLPTSCRQQRSGSFQALLRWV